MMAKERIRVFLCHKSRLMTRCMVAFLEKFPNLLVVGQATNSCEAILGIRRLLPDIAIAHQDLPVIGGYALCRVIKKDGLVVRTILLHDKGRASMSRLEPEAHADLLLSLESEEQAFLGAIRSVRQGENGQGQPCRIAQSHQSSNGGNKLTDRQKEVVGLIAAGYTNKEIAVELGVALKTVESHRLSVMQRLDLHNAQFSINGNQLRTAAVFDYEARTSYSIRVQSGDQGGLFTEKAFTISVTDVDETCALGVTITPTQFSEGAGPRAATGRVTRTGLTSSALVVTLTSSDTTEATVPATVTIQEGSTYANFDVSAVDDWDFDGPQNVTITALATSSTPGNANVTVTDNEVPTLTITAPAPDAFEPDPDGVYIAIFPPAWSGTFAVNRTGSDLSRPLVVKYAIQGTATNGVDYERLTGTVDIPANVTSADLLVLPYTDYVIEGNETVILSLMPDVWYTIGSPRSLSEKRGLDICGMMGAMDVKERADGDKI